MILPVITTMKDTKENKRIKTKIGVEYAVKVRGMEEKTSEVRTRCMRKEVVCCVQYMEGKKKFVVPFEDGQKRYMSASSLS